MSDRRSKKKEIHNPSLCFNTQERLSLSGISTSIQKQGLDQTYYKTFSVYTTLKKDELTRAENAEG